MINPNDSGRLVVCDVCGVVKFNKEDAFKYAENFVWADNLIGVVPILTCPACEAKAPHGDNNNV